MYRKIWDFIRNHDNFRRKYDTIAKAVKGSAFADPVEENLLKPSKTSRSDTSNAQKLILVKMFRFYIQNSDSKTEV